MEPMEGASTVEQMLLNRAKINKTPISGSLELSPLCNMNCDMCYVRMSRGEMEKHGALKSADDWLEIGKQMQNAGVIFLLLTGGEPLLYPEFKKVYLGLRQMGMILTVNTNGTLINEEWADFFAQNKPRRINITLYGASEATYRSLCHYGEGYDRTINAVKLLTQRGIDVKLGASAARSNGSEIEKIIEQGDTLGVPVRVDSYMMPATRERDIPYSMQSRLDPEDAAKVRIMALRREMGEETFSQFVMQTLDRIEHFTPSDNGCRMTCYAGNCSFTINWQGQMRPCVVLSQPSVSVFENGFENAWKYINRECEKIRLNSKCGECKLRPLCRTCAASAFLETGDYEGIPDYMCRYAEKSFRLIKSEAERIRNE